MAKEKIADTRCGDRVKGWVKMEIEDCLFDLLSPETLLLPAEALQFGSRPVKKFEPARVGVSIDGERSHASNTRNKAALIIVNLQHVL